MKMKDLIQEGKEIQEKFKKKTSLNEGIFGNMIKSIAKRASKVELNPKILLDVMDGSFLPYANDLVKKELYPKMNDEQKAKLEKTLLLIRHDLESEIRNGWITSVEELGKRYSIVSLEKMKNF
jgi:hypothetical protein